MYIHISDNSYGIIPCDQIPEQGALLTATGNEPLSHTLVPSDCIEVQWYGREGSIYLVFVDSDHNVTDATLSSVRLVRGMGWNRRTEQVLPQSTRIKERAARMGRRVW